MSVPLALEITPPKEAKLDVLLRRAAALGPAPRRIHVVERAERMSSFEASLVLRGAGFAPVWHWVQRGRTRAELESELARAVAADLRDVLIVRGEARGAEAAGAPTLRELVARARVALPAARLGVTWNPYQPGARPLSNLLGKLEAGARFVQTQPLFSPAPLEALARALEGHAPRIELWPMVVPLLSVDGARRFAARIGAPLPDALMCGLERGGAEAGWRAFRESLAALAATGLAAGIVVATQTLDPPAELAARLR